MKKILSVIIIFCLLSCGCAPAPEPSQIAATTAPVWEFTAWLCRDTDLTVTRLVTENVSCLHDYTLQVHQMQAVEGAEVVIISGAGLEEFLHDALACAEDIVDASEGVELICPEEGNHHDHGHEDHGHHHENDPHIWLSPTEAAVMARNICQGLANRYPQYANTFEKNLTGLLAELDALDAYGKAQLSDLSCREIITFHDGFAYFADSFGLEILKAVEEESGSEASAADLIELINLVRQHHLTAVFMEANGSSAAAYTIAAETGATVYTLDMAMAGGSYFDAMYRNIDTIKEALG